jgi:hypothetical protein
MNLLPPQPSLVVSYLRVGRLLYWSLIIFLVESWFYWQKLKAVLVDNSHLGWIFFWVWCFLFSFLHIFLVLADGWSRFQNYKRAKDQFFLHGFHPRIADRYMVSKCQRMAAIEAATELGLKNEIEAHYITRGVKWYHFVPYFMTNDFWFGFRRKFWSRTFLEPHYTPRYDFHQLQNTSLAV